MNVFLFSWVITHALDLKSLREKVSEIVVFTTIILTTSKMLGPEKGPKFWLAHCPLNV